MAELMAEYSPPMPTPAMNRKAASTAKFQDSPASPLPIR